MVPNSEPDSLTPKNWNLVRVPGQREEDGEGDVVVGVPPPAEEDELVGVPGKHCE